jgi:hypothetical protein
MVVLPRQGRAVGQGGAVGRGEAVEGEAPPEPWRVTWYDVGEPSRFA